jgi:hypothetical protein
LDPLLEKFVALFLLGLLGQVVGEEEAENLLELIKHEHDLVIAVGDSLDIVLDVEESPDISEVFLRDLAAFRGLGHEFNKQFSQVFGVVLHGGSNSNIGLGGNLFIKSSRVGRSTDVDHVSLLIAELNLDFYSASTSDGVNDRVLSIILVDDLARDILFFFIIGFDRYIELIASGLAVFAVVVSGLDEELNGLVDGHVFHETTSETERVNGSSVQEEAEITPGGGEVLVAHGQLDNTVLGSMDRVVR